MRHNTIEFCIKAPLMAQLLHKLHPGMGLRNISVEDVEHLHQYVLKAIKKFGTNLLKEDGGKKLLHEVLLLKHIDEDAQK